MVERGPIFQLYQHRKEQKQKVLLQFQALVDSEIILHLWIMYSEENEINLILLLLLLFNQGRQQDHSGICRNNS